MCPHTGKHIEAQETHERRQGHQSNVFIAVLTDDMLHMTLATIVRMKLGVIGVEAAGSD
jgi:hypothetical protein